MALIATVPRTRLAIPAWAIATVAAGAWLFLFRNSLVDDAFITLQQARTFAVSGTWGFYPGLEVNTQTSPLNLVLLASLIKVGLDPIIAAVLLATAAYGAMAAILPRLGPGGWLAWGALLVNPLLLSTIGLETLPQAALLCGLLLALQQRRPVVAMTLCAALTLIRPDGIVFAGVAFLFVPSIMGVIVYAGLTAPWFLCAWAHFGSPIPDTLRLKLEARPGESFLTGPWLYFTYRPVETIASVALATAGVLFARGRLALIGMTLAGAHFLAYSILGVFPAHWYYGPEITILTVLGALGLSRFPAVITFPALALPLAAVLLGGFAEAPLHANWGTVEQYRQIGQDISRDYPGIRLRVVGEVGTLGYDCDCQLIDPYTSPAPFPKADGSLLMTSGECSPVGLARSWRIQTRNNPPASVCLYRP